MPCDKMISVLIFAAAVFFCILTVLLFVAAIKNGRKLKKFQKESSLFLSSAAHDLKSPLTNIKGYADAILSGDLNGTEKDDALSVISFESERLSKIAARLCIDGGFDEKNGKYKLSMSVFGICDVLHYIGSLLEKKALRRNIEIIYSFPEEEIYVFADKDAVIEVVYNLFDNALKYCDDGGKAELCASADCDSKKGVCTVAVRNTAPVDYDTKNEIPSYFNAGFRGKNSAASHGHGLGLYIARELINAHGKELKLSVEPQTDVNEAQCCRKSSSGKPHGNEKNSGEISANKGIYDFSFCLDLATEEADGKAL